LRKQILGINIRKAQDSYSTKHYTANNAIWQLVFWFHKIFCQCSMIISVWVSCT